MRPSLPTILFLTLLVIPLACGVVGQASVEGTNRGECSDEIDNDNDGLMDCLDSDCAESAVCAATGNDDDSAADDDDSTPPCDEEQELEMICDDGCDNDNNGLTDCDDIEACLADPACDGVHPGDDDDGPQGGPCVDMPCCCEPDIITGEPTCTTCLEHMAPPPLGCGGDPKGWKPDGHHLEEGSTVCCGFGTPPACAECEDGIDNDGDGLIDELDDGCSDWFKTLGGGEMPP